MVNEFLALLDSFNLTQSICGSTHIKGHTLDLVLSSGISVDKLDITNVAISDHFLIEFEFSSYSPPSVPPPSHVLARSFNSATASLFSNSFKFALPPSLSADLPSCTNIDELVSSFNLSCTNTLDQIAPIKLKRVKSNTLTPWVDSSIQVFRQACRQAERKWKKDKLQVSYDIFLQHLKAYQVTVKKAKANYFSELINSQANRPKVLFKAIDTFLNPANTVDTSLTCDEFSDYFIRKIDLIRSNIITQGRISVTSCSPANFLQHFTPLSSPELSEIVSHLKPSCCPFDIIPFRLFKEVFDVLSPIVLAIVNCSLYTGVVPSGFKHAVVQPLLKKNNLDPNDPGNFRPISKLSFISKILEKEVFKQISSFLTNFNILDKFQSGFRALHSTESALLKVYNDILLTIDSGSSALLILLDLSAAFDTIDHGILIDRLEHSVGLQGPVLRWFKSYLTERTFSVKLGAKSSPPVDIKYGVPQGSVLGPLLFSLYMLPLGSILEKHNLRYHCYADDTLLYLPISPSCTSDIEAIFSCLEDIKSWMAENFLQLNTKKTEMILFGSPTTSKHWSNALGPWSSNLQNLVRNLGVIFDSSLNFNKQVSSVVKGSFYQLRTVAKLKHFLSKKDLETIIHAFVSSRLDYCNSLYTGLTKHNLNRLQLVQNAAARLLTGTKKCEHITPVLAELHWLPVKFRIDFKILLFVFKALHGQAPLYISELLSTYSAARPLRSTTQLLLAIPKTRLKTRGDRAFSVIAPKLWNSLPFHIKSCNTIVSFKTNLKTHFYSLAFNSL